jgi:hypothetical protein
MILAEHLAKFLCWRNFEYHFCTNHAQKFTVFAAMWKMGFEQVGYLAGIFFEGQGFVWGGQGVIFLYKSKI